MKKGMWKCSPLNRAFSKCYLIVMKLFLFLTFAGVVQASAGIYSQNTLVQLNLKNATLYEAVSEIATQTGHLFLLKESESTSDNMVTLRLKDATVDEALTRVLENSSLEYSIVENYILLTPLTRPPDVKIAVQDPLTITGKVTYKADGTPLPGVNVYVKETTIGVATDMDGNYSLTVPANATILVFSLMGMKTEEIVIGLQRVIDVAMEDEAIGLGELIVVGYGTESRKLVSGSLGVVSDSEMREMPTRTIDGVLQGRTSGLYISNNSGTPGGAQSVRIRGNSSISAGNDPLYVIDGIPMTSGNYGQIGFSGQSINALSDINPNDIESITVLKDASAAAIYGARATNGVILITTRRGSQQRTNVNFNASWGWQEVAKTLDMLNAEQWHNYRGTEPDPENPVDVDWLDQVFRTAPLSSYELSAGGGDNRTKYFISGNYYNQTGILLGTDFQRLNGRLNLDHQINPNITIGGNLGVSYSLNNRVEGDRSLHGVLPNAISMAPVYPVYDPNGSYNQDGFFANPVAIGNEAINEAHSYRTIGNAYVDFRFLNHFTFSTKWGLDYLGLREHSYDPITTRQGAITNGLGIEAQSNVTNIVSNNLLRYNNTFNVSHHIEALAGYSFESFQRRSQYAEGIDFPNEYFQYLLDAGTIRLADASAIDRGINSFFGQAKYNFNYKYIVTLTGRFDGSSKFGENNRYGFFPAASLAWRISEEDFFKALNIPFNEFRLRTSYGQTGNDGIPDFAYMDLYRGRANYLSRAGIAPAGIPNPDLKWETTNQFNIGTDIEVLKERITVSFDYYHNITNDLLFSRPVSMTSGFSSITTNIGELQNKGVELSLSTVNVKTSNLEWGSRLNLSHNKNEILSLYKDQNLLDLDRYSPSAAIVGEPMSVFYGFRSLGVDPSTGDIVFADLDGNGVINSEDREIIGDPNPIFAGGFTNNLYYGNFEFSFFLQFSYGNDVFNATRIFTEAMKGPDNQTTEILRRWQQPGDITDMPRATETDPNANNRISSRFVEDGSFLKLKTLTLAYRFDESLIERIGFKSARIYFTGANLFTITNYSGMDPEVNYRGDSNLLRATDFFTYPQARTFTFGVNIGL
jgi:TonB-dependent starch-binding outer membrane protein SusC